jgi:site-specific DNA recombinase
MQVGIYARVSSQQQAKTQTIEHQVSRALQYVEEHGWTCAAEQIYRDEGYSGASLSRPALDRLRDAAAQAAFETIIISAPDRLARKYLHQALLLEELERYGIGVVFLERPMSDDPNDQLLLQIRGAVAEYERTLITERMRRGKLAKLRAGQLLPWTRGHYGYQVDPDRPWDPEGVRINAYEAQVVQQIVQWYTEPGATLYSVCRQLDAHQVPSPRGRPYWTGGSVRDVLRDPTYTGTAYANRYHKVAARGRKSPVVPMGSGTSYTLRPPQEWIAIPVPAIIAPEAFELVHTKLALNQQFARRNLRHEFLLRGLVSCGHCQLSTEGRTTPQGHRYYVCRGRRDPLRCSQGKRCTARYVPVAQLDAIVWEDLCHLILDPAHLATVLERIHAGAWVPQELTARQKSVQQALASCERQQERLLSAYLAEIIDLAELERKRRETDHKMETLRTQQKQLEVLVVQRKEVQQVATSIEAFCQQIREGLTSVTVDQQRCLVELLVDRVIVMEEEVEIRYVFPISEYGAHHPFCQLRLDYVVLDRSPQPFDEDIIQGATAPVPADANAGCC